MSDLVSIIGCVEVIAFIFGIMIFWGETGRLPLARRRWVPYIKGDHPSDTNQVIVGVERKHDKVQIGTCLLNADDYLEQLANLESEARERCIALNTTNKGLQRKLPR